MTKSQLRSNNNISIREFTITCGLPAAMEHTVRKALQTMHCIASDGKPAKHYQDLFVCYMGRNCVIDRGTTWRILLTPKGVSELKPKILRRLGRK